ncbi:hypothetical protein ACG97_05970 [Vogesella sp. EB]|uniref:hypothetical protein n=1 Tax=Vogesella sp. EB TaxID=1526735 RepID=UPI00064D5AE0|nr:hypothetical protein [Vogesella sp. EB]KMJ53790.1 hypothetical protein ACG97_05970 [Vogesella sp. EB]
MATNSSFLTGNYQAASAPNTVGWGAAPTDIKNLPNALMQQGWNMASQPYQQYGGDRLANFSGEQNKAMDMITNRATNGDPTMQAGAGMVQNTLNGQYMSPDSNPWLKGTYDAMAGRMSDAYARGTGAQTMAQFNNAGAYGGSAMQEVQQANNTAFADSLGQLANQVYGDNYQQERGRQLQAGLMAPTYGNQAYTDAAALQGVGAAKQAQDQSKLDMNYSDWQNAKNWGYTGYDMLSGMLGSSSNAQQLAQNADQFNRQNSGGSNAANWIGGGLGLLGTLGNTNVGGSSLLDHAWSGLSSLWE